MRFSRPLLIGVVGLLLCLAIGSAYAAQIIYVEVSTFDRALSQFNVDVKGNKWVETSEKGAINGRPEVLEQARDLGRRVGQGEMMGPIKMDPLVV